MSVNKHEVLPKVSYSSDKRYMVTGDTGFELDKLIWLSGNVFALENIVCIWFASARFEHKRTPQCGSLDIHWRDYPSSVVLYT